MTHYTTNSGSVRIEQFKPNGKWYQTCAGDMSGYYWGGGERCPKGSAFNLIHEAVARVITDTFGPQGSADWIYVILAPYHENGYPMHMTSAQVVQHLDEWYRAEDTGKRVKP